METNRFISLAVFLFFLAFYVITMERTQEYGYVDGSVMFRVTQSIVEDGSFKSRVPGLYRSNSYITNSRYGLGFSFATIPFYLIAKEIGKYYSPQFLESFTRRSSMFTNSLISALGCLVFYQLALNIFKNRKLSLLLTLLYGVTTMTWSYAHSDFSEPLTTLFILLSAYYLIQIQNENSSAISNVPSRIFFTGLFLGLAIFTRFASIILIPIYAYLLIQTPNFKFQVNKSVILFSLPLLCLIGICLWYNVYRYGSIWKTGYETDLTNPLLGRIFFSGLYGLLLSPGKGIFWYNPILLLAIVGLPIFWKKNRRICIFTLAIFTTHLILYSLWPAWEGGWCWGPRNLIPAIPFLMLAVGYAIQESKIQNYFLWILGLLGFLIQFAGQTIPYDYYIQSLLDRHVAFSDIWFVPANSPIGGAMVWLSEIHVKLWNFLIIPLLQSQQKDLVVIILSLLLVILLVSGTYLGRIFFAKQE